METNSLKERWLLHLGITILISAIVLTLIIGTDHYNGSRTFSGFSIVSLILLAVVFAPIAEELICRGTFTGNRILKWSGLIGLPVFLLVSERNGTTGWY